VNTALLEFLVFYWRLIAFGIVVVVVLYTFHRLASREKCSRIGCGKATMDQRLPPLCRNCRAKLQKAAEVIAIPAITIDREAEKPEPDPEAAGTATCSNERQLDA
jgi:hypothetical protein